MNAERVDRVADRRAVEAVRGESVDEVLQVGEHDRGELAGAQVGVDVFFEGGLVAANRARLVRLPRAIADRAVAHSLDQLLARSLDCLCTRRPSLAASHLSERVNSAVPGSSCTVGPWSSYGATVEVTAGGVVLPRATAGRGISRSSRPLEPLPAGKPNGCR